MILRIDVTGLVLALKRLEDVEALECGVDLRLEDSCEVGACELLEVEKDWFGGYGNLDRWWNCS